MKKILFFVFMVYSLSNAQNSSSVSPFLSDIFSQFPNVRDISISNDGNEVYFSVQSYLGELSAIVVVKKEDKNWSKPEVASFSGQFHDMEPFLAPNGLKLFFASNRPMNFSEEKTKDFDIWVVQRSNIKGEWSAPKNLGNPINTNGDEFFPSIAANGNLYFTGNHLNSKGKDYIFLSKLINETYSDPISLDTAINSEGYEFNSFVAPDESFLLFTGYNRTDGFGSGDLYISFKNENGTWEKAKNLGNQINSDKMDYCPFVDLKDNSLYFTSKRDSTKKSFTTKQSLNQIFEELNKYENGLSRVYRTILN